MADDWKPPNISKSPLRDSRRIALNLSDLLESNDSMAFSQAKYIDPGSYQRELNKLLLKSRGTAYESVLQKFIETKFLDQQCQSKRSSDSISYLNQDVGRFDVSGLQASKFERSQNLEKLSAESPSNFPDSTQRLEAMSKPLDRNIWKVREGIPMGKESDLNCCFQGPKFGIGVTVPDRITTNHLGRQRPPPRRPEDSTGETSSVSVSIRDFDQWLKKNREWKSKCAAKTRKVAEDRQSEEKELASPRIWPQSTHLADVANAKYIHSLLQHADVTTSASLQEDSSDIKLMRSQGGYQHEEDGSGAYGEVEASRRGRSRRSSGRGVSARPSLADGTSPQGPTRQQQQQRYASPSPGEGSRLIGTVGVRARSVSPGGNRGWGSTGASFGTAAARGLWGPSGTVGDFGSRPRSPTPELMQLLARKSVQGATSPNQAADSRHGGEDDEHDVGAGLAPSLGLVKQLSVYERLALRASDHVQRQANRSPLIGPDEAFTPRICEYSRQLATARRTRCASAGSRRPEDIGIREYIRLTSPHRRPVQASSRSPPGGTGAAAGGANAGNSGHRPHAGASSTVDARDEGEGEGEDDGKKGRLSILSLQSNASMGSRYSRHSGERDRDWDRDKGLVEPGAGHEDSDLRGRSPSLRRRDGGGEMGGGGGERDLSARRSQSRSISRSRSRSRMPLVRKTAVLLKEEESLQKSKPFQPTILAAESKRIMERHHEAFDERLTKSVENYYVRKTIAARAYRPGPGHYVHVDITGVSPLRGSAHRTATAEVAPRGYTWGKEKRDSFLLPEDEKRVKEAKPGKLSKSAR